MRRGWFRPKGTVRRGLTALSAAAIAAAALGTGSAQAATGHPRTSPHQVNHSGTYNGQINQTLPKPFAGHIHFVVRRAKITRLRFTTGTMCGATWAVDKDHALSTFLVKVRSSGGFFYKGTVAGRLIRLSGKLNGNKAHGTFFQAFPLGDLTCTMGQAAPFTATR